MKERYIIMGIGVIAYCINKGWNWPAIIISIPLAIGIINRILDGQDGENGPISNVVITRSDNETIVDYRKTGTVVRYLK